MLAARSDSVKYVIVARLDFVESDYMTFAELEVAAVHSCLVVHGGRCRAGAGGVSVTTRARWLCVAGRPRIPLQL